MATPSNAPATDHLPEELRQQLAAFEARLRRTHLAAAVSGAVAILAAAVLAVFISDRAWDTSPAVRFGLNLAAWGIVVGLAAQWIRTWLIQRRSLRDLATLVQGRYRQLGDRLLGAVELANPDHRPADISPSLVAAAIRQVAVEAGRYDFAAAVDRSTLRRRSLGLAVLLVLLLIALVVAPAAVGNALTRWLMPFGHAPRYTFAALDDLPAELVVPHGEAFDLPFQMRDDARWQPTHATAQLGVQVPLTADVIEGAGRFHIPGQTADVDLRLRAGDAQRVVRIHPLHRPVLQEIAADITYPPYLELPPARLPFRNGSLAVPLGSQLAVAGTANRPLHDVHLAAPAGVLPATVTGASFTAAPRPADALADLTLTWSDSHLLAGDSPLRLTVRETPDNLPDVDCPRQNAVSAILVEESIEIAAIAHDDHGLRQLSVSWSVADRATPDKPSRQETTVLADGTPHTTELTGVFRFSPKLLDVPERSVVTLVASTRDYHPDHQPVASRVFTIHILGHAEHAQLLQQQFDKLRARLEDLARTEENLKVENANLLKLDPKDLRSEATTETLKRQEQAEENQSARLREMAMDTAKLLKEAMRNPDVPPELTASWSRLLDTMEQVGSQDMPQLQNTLKNATANPASRQSQVDKAVTQQQAILDKLRDLQQQADESVKDMIARNFYMRLKELADRERRVAERLGRYMPSLAGLEPTALDAGQIARLNELRGVQQQVRKDTDGLMRELDAFYNRTRLEKYDAVNQAMRQGEVLVALDAIDAHIGANRGATAIASSTRLADLFDTWAKMLEPPKKDDPNGGGGGGGGGGMSEDQMKLLMAIMKVLMEQEDLRATTRTLHTNKDVVLHYADEARQLAGRQGGLTEFMRQLYEVVDADSQKIFDKAGLAMGEAAQLLNNLQTGDITVASQNEALELLMAGFDSAAQKMGSGNPQQMAMMLKMIMNGEKPGEGNAPGKNGGGNKSPQASDLAGLEATSGGDPASESRASRDRTAGKTLDAVPQEFREAMEAYYQKLDAAGL